MEIKQEDEKLNDLVQSFADLNINEDSKEEKSQRYVYSGKTPMLWTWDYMYDYNKGISKGNHSISGDKKTFNCKCKQFCFCFYSSHYEMRPNSGIYEITIKLTKYFKGSHENIIGITTTKHSLNGININNNKQEWSHAWQHELTDFIGWSPRNLFCGNPSGKQGKNIFYQNKYQYHSNNGYHKKGLPPLSDNDVITLKYDSYSNTLSFITTGPTKNTSYNVNSYISHLPHNVSFYWFAGRVYGEMSMTIINGNYRRRIPIGFGRNYGAIGKGNSNSNKRRPFSNISFEQESAIKKQYYRKSKSIDEMTEDEVDNIVIDKNPHFVLTLNNLNDLSLEGENKNDNNNEMTELKRLNQCIKNGINDAKIELIREKLGNVYGVNKNNVIVTDIFYGTTNIAYIIWDWTKNKVKEIVKNVKEFKDKVAKYFEEYKDVKITDPIADSVDGSYQVVKSYHVSCASRKLCNKWKCNVTKHSLGGVVLYMKDNKTDWYCNGRHCKIGYIIVKPTDGIQSKYPSSGAIHGSVYKSVFNQDPDSSVVGSGFARHNGVWKWNSGVFNSKKDEWHTKTCGRTMNQIEQEWIEKAVKQWHDTGKQNIIVTEPLVIFKEDYQ